MKKPDVITQLDLLQLATATAFVEDASKEVKKLSVKFNRRLARGAAIEDGPVKYDRRTRTLDFRA